MSVVYCINSYCCRMTATYVLYRLQFFLKHDQDGNIREVIWSGSLLTSEGRQTAAKFLLWLSNGAKGYKSISGRKPAERLVRISLPYSGLPSFLIMSAPEHCLKFAVGVQSSTDYFCSDH